MEWECVDVVLESMNVGPNFSKWVQMLYKHSQSAILTNGYVSETFNLSRSLRQGCPMAELLYIIQAESRTNGTKKSEKM